ncbi:MAG: 4'-phosphopantetheinyl transferase superfamily protein [Paludibacter sp.]|nr:4'-phosphopantetheinyl transferase superfamily protein [Paludibacter sp.]
MKFQIRTEDGLSILVKPMTETVDELIEKLGNFNVYKSDYLKLTTEKRRLEFLNIRVGFNALLGKDVLIMYNENGKPYISDSQWNISVSHSKKLIALAVHPSKTVGIDVEYFSDKVQRIYKRFLSPIEQEELFSDNDTEKLMIVWSAKEALYKIIGKEAVDFAQQLRIFPFEKKECGEIEAEHKPSLKRFNLNYSTTSEYLVVYCLA